MPLEHFLEVSFETSSSGVGVVLATLSSAIILAVALPTAYFFYYKKRDATAVSVRSFLKNPLYLLVSNGYYFDAVYSKILSGVIGLSEFTYRFVEASLQKFPYAVATVASKIAHGTSQYIETFFDRFVYIVAGGAVETARRTHVNLDALLDRLCYILAGGTVETARVTHEYIDTFLDKLVYLFAGKTVEQGQKLSKVHRGHLPDFVLAAAFGFFLIIILLLFTALR
jgi:hypothetical protein